VGDYGGGTMFLIFGLLAGIISARSTGKGQVVDAAMVDGVSALMALFHGMQADGMWTDQRDSNLLDGGAHFYDVYETADGRYLSVGAIEPQFDSLLMKGLGFAEGEFPGRMSRDNWPAYSARIAERVREQPLAHWVGVFEGTDACVAPVLTMSEAAEHPHIRARGTLVRTGGRLAAAPAPRFSGTPAAAVEGIPDAAPARADLLEGWGLDEATAVRLAGG